MRVVRLYSTKTAASASSAAPSTTSTAAASSTKVLTFGHGTFGGLGHGNFLDSPNPQIVEALEHEEIISIASGWTSSLAVTRSGRVYRWGWRSEVPHMLRLSRFRRRFTWLTNKLIRFRYGDEPKPIALAGFGPDGEFGQAVGAKSGGEAFAIHTHDNQVYTMGGNLFCETGQPNAKMDSKYGKEIGQDWVGNLTRVSGVSDVKQVACGYT